MEYVIVGVAGYRILWVLVLVLVWNTVFEFLLKFFISDLSLKKVKTTF